MERRCLGKGTRLLERFDVEDLGEHDLAGETGARGADGDQRRTLGLLDQLVPLPPCHGRLVLGHLLENVLDSVLQAVGFAAEIVKQACQRPRVPAAEIVAPLLRAGHRADQKGHFLLRHQRLQDSHALEDRLVGQTLAFTSEVGVQRPQLAHRQHHGFRIVDDLLQLAPVDLAVPDRMIRPGDRVGEPVVGQFHCPLPDQGAESKFLGFESPHGRRGVTPPVKILTVSAKLRRSAKSAGWRSILRQVEMKSSFS